ncbi:MAG: hypothetical protein MJZ15_00770 [Bacteroidales bacterium]|nr:hypothetical protein [Bacteroidales bacterium]
MNLTVTQQNLHLFLPAKVARVATIIAEKEHCSVFDAMQHFYASSTYQELQIEDTKLWNLGAVALYEAYCSATQNIQTIVSQKGTKGEENAL